MRRLAGGATRIGGCTVFARARGRSWSRSLAPGRRRRGTARHVASDSGLAADAGWAPRPVEASSGRVDRPRRRHDRRTTRSPPRRRLRPGSRRHGHEADGPRRRVDPQHVAGVGLGRPDVAAGGCESRPLRPGDSRIGAAVGASVSGSRRRSAAGLTCSAHRSFPLCRQRADEHRELPARKDAASCASPARRSSSVPNRRCRCTSTEASSLSPTCARYVARPPREIRCLTAPEARSRRRSGRVRTVVLLSVRATQSPSSPGRHRSRDGRGTRSVAVTPRVVMAEPDPCVASQTEPTIAATTDTTTTASRYRRAGRFGVSARRSSSTPPLEDSSEPEAALPPLRESPLRGRRGRPRSGGGDPDRHRALAAHLIGQPSARAGPSAASPARRRR